MLHTIPFHASLLKQPLNKDKKSTNAHVLVYGAIEIHNMGEKGCIASNEKIATETGYSKQRVADVISEMAAAGWLKVIMKDGKKNAMRERIIPLIEPGIITDEGFLPVRKGFLASKNIDNSIDNNPTGSAEQAPPSPKEKEEPTILKLYYDVLKAHDILVTNNSHVRGWAKKLEEQAGYENAARYLNFLLVIDFAAIEKAEWNTGADRAFVPTLTTAYDVISKRSKFRNCLNKAIELTGGLDSLPRRKNETTT